MRAARALFRLSPEARTATLEAALVLSAVRVGFVVVPARLTGPLLRRACAPGVGSTSAAEVTEVVRGVERAARRIPGATCLSQALTAWLMLRRRSIASTLRIGVARADARLSAHAWLEHDGAIVLGAESAHSHTSFPPPPP